MKDEKKRHGTVDESSSEQQFRKSDAITLFCEISGAVHLALVGLMAGWQAGRQNSGEFRKL